MNSSSWKITKLVNHNAHTHTHTPRFLFEIKFLEGSFCHKFSSSDIIRSKNEGGSSIIKRPMKTSDIA